MKINHVSPEKVTVKRGKVTHYDGIPAMGYREARKLAKTQNVVNFCEVYLGSSSWDTPEIHLMEMSLVGKTFQCKTLQVLS